MNFDYLHRTLTCVFLAVVLTACGGGGGGGGNSNGGAIAPSPPPTPAPPPSPPPPPVGGEAPDEDGTGGEDGSPGAPGSVDEGSGPGAEEESESEDGEGDEEGEGEQNAPPVLSVLPNLTFPENAPVSFPVRATDADDDPTTITLQPTGDGAFFSYNAELGYIISRQSFNFEAPEDADTDNVYELTVTVSDGKATVSHLILVAITDVDDPPTCSYDVEVEFPENETGLVYTFDGADEDGPGTYSELLFSARPFLSSLPASVSGALRLNQATGEFFIDAPLDAEDFEPGVVIFLQTSYRQAGQLASCSARITIAEKPNIVTSGIKLNGPVSATENAGDLNGDGFDELWLQGRRSNDAIQSDVSGHLVFGRALADAVAATGAAELNLSTLGSSQAVRIFTSNVENVPAHLNGGGETLVARYVADLDGDGLPELLLGQRANGVETNFQSAGRIPAAYLVWGKTLRANTSGMIDLQSMRAEDGIVIRLAVGSKRRSLDVTSADFDGDGLPDIVIGQPEPIQDGNISYVQTQIVFGPTLLAARSAGRLDLTNHPEVVSFYGASNQPSGHVVVSPGDVDGDGLDDVFIGTQSTGVAFLPGRAIADAPRGVRQSFWSSALFIALNRGGDLARQLPDIDGDGIPDLLATAVGDFLTPNASLVLGSVLRAALPMPAGVSTTIDSAGSFTRFNSVGFNRNLPSLTGLGDLDGDGRDEIAAGGWSDNEGNLRRVFVVMGSTANSVLGASLDMNSMTSGQGVEITPWRTRDTINRSITAISDIDGDGIRELVLVELTRGQAYILLGSEILSSVSSGRTVLDLGMKFEFEP